MYTAAKSSFPKINSTTMIIEMEQKINELRQIQKDCFNKIKSKFYKSIQLSKTELDYLWNLYYNFVIREFSFNTNNEFKHVTTFTTMNHIGMKMLNEMK